jgi:hypothetical protein
MLRYCVVAGLLLLTLPAMAQQRPRDAVMARAYRCGAIGAPRQWLDCYYGAAQPARAQLGLPPAPQAQIELALSPPAGNASTRVATVRDAVMASSLRCYATQDDRAWLDCYYAAAGPTRSELGLSAWPQVAQTPAPVPPPPSPASVPASDASAHFGFKSLPSRSTDHVAARMASYNFDRNHIFTVTLANGETWRQVSGDTHTARWNKPAGTYSVKITHGSFSSYNFQVLGLPEVYKVDRIG